MKLLVLLAGGALALFTAVGAQAEPLGFATDTNQNLYQIDFNGASTTLIGNTGVFFEGIAMAPNGALYGTAVDGNFYSINATNGAATLIGNTNLGNIEGLDFNGNTLLGVDFNGTPKVYSIDLATGVATLVATADTATGAVRSMAVLDANTILIRGDAGDNTLFSMNLATGAVTTIGTQTDTIFGMDFLSDGGLYGLSDDGAVYTINAGTGALTLNGGTGEQFWLSLTTAEAAVPEPGSLALLGLALAGLGLTRRRKLH